MLAERVAESDPEVWLQGEGWVSVEESALTNHRRKTSPSIIDVGACWFSQHNPVHCCYVSSAYSCTWALSGPGQRLQKFKHINFEDILGQVNDNFSNLHVIPATGYLTEECYKAHSVTPSPHHAHPQPHPILLPLSPCLALKEMGEKHSIWRMGKWMKFQLLAPSL